VNLYATYRMLPFLTTLNDIADISRAHSTTFIKNGSYKSALKTKYNTTIRHKHKKYNKVEIE